MMSSEGSHPSQPDLQNSVSSLEDLEAAVTSGDIASLARAITLTESLRADHQQLSEQLLTRLLPHTGDAIRVGIAGPPGVGKSTFVEALGMHLVAKGHRVAVLAVDPSSTITGGSILGDKTRMERLSADPNAFIRPSPSAGKLGGVAESTRECLLLCEAAGFDVVLIETVGVGQSEIAVSEMTDCFLALLQPGAGDELQAIKRGLLERVDVVAVNKADGDNLAAATVTAKQLENSLSLSADSAITDRIPVLTCSAKESTGVSEVWAALSNHYQQLCTSGRLLERRKRQSRHSLWQLVECKLLHAVRNAAAFREIRQQLEQAVEEGTMTPNAAAQQLIQQLGFGTEPR